MHGLPRLGAARTAVSDYTALARTRLSELKVWSARLFMLVVFFLLQDFTDSPSPQNADVSKIHLAQLIVKAHTMCVCVCVII